MKPLSIFASGMVSSVGLSSAATCAAIRCAIDGFSETRFCDEVGEWIIGSPVEMERPLCGLPRLVAMVVPAIRECLDYLGSVRSGEIPLLLCVAEKERPGRVAGLDDELFQMIEAEIGFSFHPRSSVIAAGRVGAAVALSRARELVAHERLPFCIIAGVDSFLVPSTLAAYQAQGRLLGRQNSNGFIPGEAGTAVLVGASGTGARGQAELCCLGIGRGEESSTVMSEKPFRADGMVQAFRAALDDATVGFDLIDYRITDVNGEQYWFKEAALALTRTMRVRKQEFDIWHPVDCIGETGAAAGPCVLGVGLAAAAKGYAPGPGVLCHFSGEDGSRYALVLKSSGGGRR